MQIQIKSAISTATVITGIFFITATVSAIIGLSLYDPLLNGTNYLNLSERSAYGIIGGAFSETITCCANIGTAIMLYPYLRKFNESVGMGYVCFRFLEVVFIAIGVISMLSLLATSKAASGGTIDINAANAVGETLKATYRWAFLLGPNFILGINTFLYSYTFYRTGLVPKWLATFGITGAIFIFIAGVLQMFGVVAQLSTVHILMTLPIAVYEMVLAGYLIVKGVHTSRAALEIG